MLRTTLGEMPVKVGVLIYALEIIVEGDDAIVRHPLVLLHSNIRQRLLIIQYTMKPAAHNAFVSGYDSLHVAEGTSNCEVLPL